MSENAARERREEGRGMAPALMALLVERRADEGPVEAEWPATWRLLTLLALAAVGWLLVAAVMHWV